MKNQFSSLSSLPAIPKCSSIWRIFHFCRQLFHVKWLTGLCGRYSLLVLSSFPFSALSTGFWDADPCDLFLNVLNNIFLSLCNSFICIIDSLRFLMPDALTLYVCEYVFQWANAMKIPLLSDTEMSLVQIKSDFRWFHYGYNWKPKGTPLQFSDFSDISDVLDDFHVFWTHLWELKSLLF